MPLRIERKLGAPLLGAQVLEHARAAQQLWARKSLQHRLALLRRARRLIAVTGVELARSVPCERPGELHRSLADTLVAEVLPLAEACRFLEREARFILAPQRLSDHTRPFWLRRVTARTTREPLGVVLILAPANYPLFLPGVQALQALAAGNAVLWKPAGGGVAAAEALRQILVGCGLDPSLLQILSPLPKAGMEAVAAGVDKVFLTGSAATGAAVLAQLSQTATPAVVELSGCDAVFVLPGASVERVVTALAFGMRMNGSATCMAPRRLFLVGDHPNLMPAMLEAFRKLPTIGLPPRTQAQLTDLFDDARRRGGEVELQGTVEALRYAVIANANADMRIAQSDVFAPVLSVFAMPDIETAMDAHEESPYALTAAIFGPEKEAQALAAQLPVGTVLVNDLIVSTADPRLSFGGRKASGFGLTRGREGLLEMTVLKTVLTQRSRDTRAYQPTTAAHLPLFAAYLQTAHGGGWRARWDGLRKLLQAASRIR
jgi:acyl-CoA reductase-like NAD-dependent aldehyde dehydrogenase